MPAPPPPVDVIVLKTELEPSAPQEVDVPPAPTVIGYVVAVNVIGVDQFRGDTE